MGGRKHGAKIKRHVAGALSSLLQRYGGGVEVRAPLNYVMVLKFVLNAVLREERRKRGKEGGW